MTRKEFLELLGITTVSTCLGCTKNPIFLPDGVSPQELTHGETHPGVDSAYTRENPAYPTEEPPPSPPKIDFIININQSQYNALKTPGGFVYHQNIIIAQTLQNTFIAASEYCTHNGVTIEFSGTQNRYNCPAHSSAFTTQGKVINGPALVNIKVYETQLSGENIRVFEA